MLDKDLEGVEVGSVVGYWSGFGCRELTVLTVTKITTTQLQTNDGARWMLRNGKKVGSNSFHARYLRLVKPEEIAAARKAQDLRDLGVKLQQNVTRIGLRIREGDISIEVEQLRAAVEALEKIGA